MTSQDPKFCGSSKKLVLCCSTLTNAERVIELLKVLALFSFLLILYGNEIG